MQPEKAQLEAARQGCRDAQGELLVQYERYLSAIAREELPPRVRTKAAESDFVQRTFAKAMDHFEQFRGDSPDDVRAWLRGILINEMRQEHRALHASKRDVNCERSMNDSRAMIEPHDTQPTPRTDAADREEVERLHRAMAKLSEDYRQVVQLRSWERVPFKEIAEQMDRSETAVQKLWARAVVQLQRELESLDE